MEIRLGHWSSEYSTAGGKRLCTVDADTAVRLSRFFGTTEQFWINLQGAYEVSRVMAEQGTEIERIQPQAASASR